MASGWNLWVWLPCIGVVSGCCCKEVYRYPHIIINFPYSTCISSFFGSIIPISLFIFKCFFRSCIIYERYNYERGPSSLHDPTSLQVMRCVKVLQG